MRKFQLGLKTLAFCGKTQAALAPASAAPTYKQTSLDGAGWFSGIVAHTKTRSLRVLCTLLLGMTTFVTTTPVAQAATATKYGGGGVGGFADGYGTSAWEGGTKGTANGSRSWEGTYDAATNTGTFVKGPNNSWASFSSTWASAGGNWIPAIGRTVTGRMNSMATNYNIQWTGTGSVTLNNSNYTFGPKFNIAVKADGTAPGWIDYNYTSSYECYIVMHTNKNQAQKDALGFKMGTFTPPGESVAYDCYRNDTGSFYQLYAIRKENTWSGPANIQAIVKYWAEKSQTSLNYDTWWLSTGLEIGAETFDTAGNFALTNVQIPALNTALPLPTTPTNLLSNPSFDAENFDTQTPSGWSEWEGDGNGNSTTATSSYTESYGGSKSGARHGTHYKGSAHSVYTFQVKTGLANGLYTLRAWAKRSGGQTTCYLEAADTGSAKKTVNIPQSSTYQLIEIKDINVTNGQCKIGFWTVSGGWAWSYFDDVSFFKQ